jgi:hypothetical protein
MRRVPDREPTDRRSRRTAVTARVRSWLRIATGRSVLRRSLATALVVGAILAAINHGDAVLRGRIDAGLALQIALTFFVPFAVATVSSVAAIEGHIDAADAAGSAADHPPSGGR